MYTNQDKKTPKSLEKKNHQKNIVAILQRGISQRTLKSLKNKH